MKNFIKILFILSLFLGVTVFWTLDYQEKLEFLKDNCNRFSLDEDLEILEILETFKHFESVGVSGAEREYVVFRENKYSSFCRVEYIRESGLVERVYFSKDD